VRMSDPEIAVLGRQSPSAQSSPARPGGSEYAELSRLVWEAGLLHRRTLYYTWKIAVTVGALAAGWAAFVVVGNSSWRTLAVAGLLAVLFTQVGFLGHDAGHRQIFGSRRSSYIAGALLGNLGIGLSYGWWIAKHNHRAHPNTEGADPDIATGALNFHRHSSECPPEALSGSCGVTRHTCFPDAAAQGR
jgi:fatty acid desaturase